MSYLNLPRLTFAGLFEADVSTVNNDVRNFSVSTFEPRFQTPQVTRPDQKVEFNGWWRQTPTGTRRTSRLALPFGINPTCRDHEFPSRRRSKRGRSLRENASEA
jgi:hypothetical protein